MILTILVMPCTNCVGGTKENLTQKQILKDSLMIAAREGDLKKVQQVVERDSSLVNCRDDSNQTPLHIATKNNHFPIVEWLVQRNADVNLVTIDNDTALHISVRNGNYEMAKFLVDKGAEVNICLNTAGTALHSAAGLGRSDLVELLLNHGADVNARDNSDPRPRRLPPSLNTPLHYAARSHISDFGGMMPGMVNLQVIKPEKVLEVVNILLVNGADINAQNSEGSTPLDLAIQAKNQVLINLLKENGAIKGADKERETIHLSSSKFHLIRQVHFQGHDLFQLAIQAGMYKSKDNEYLPGGARQTVSIGGQTWYGSNGVGLVAYDSNTEEYQIFYLQDKAVRGHHLDIVYADNDFVLFSYGYHKELPDIKAALEVYSLKCRRFARIDEVSTKGAKFGAFSMDTLKRVNAKANPPSMGWNDLGYARHNFLELSEAGLFRPDSVKLENGIFRLSYHTGYNIEEFVTVLKFKKNDLVNAFELYLRK